MPLKTRLLESPSLQSEAASWASPDGRLEHASRMGMGKSFGGGGQLQVPGWKKLLVAQCQEIQMQRQVLCSSIQCTNG